MVLRRSSLNKSDRMVRNPQAMLTVVSEQNLTQNEGRIRIRDLTGGMTSQIKETGEIDRGRNKDVGPANSPLIVLWQASNRQLKRK